MVFKPKTYFFVYVNRIKIINDQLIFIRERTPNQLKMKAETKK